MEKDDRRDRKPTDELKTEPGDAAPEDRPRQAALRRRQIARKAEGSPERAPAEIPRGPGAPLDHAVRDRMERHLGADLSTARVHTGADSSRAASQLGAQAFTVDHDVHFGAGKFAPGTEGGDRLLAHELTHVVQGQRGGIQRKATDDVSQPADPAEREADEVADSVAARLHGRAPAEAKSPAIRAGRASIARSPDGASPPQAAATTDAAAQPSAAAATEHAGAATDGGPATPATVTVADAMCEVTSAQPVEARVVSVDEQVQPWFDSTASVSFAQIAAGFRSNPIPESELHAVSAITLGGAPEKSATLSGAASATGLELHLSHASSPQSINATTARVQLASGKSFILHLHASQFHCDTQVWEREMRLRDIARRQQQNAELSAGSAQAQQVLRPDAPAPPPDPTLQRQLDGELAQIPIVNKRIQDHTAELQQQFRDREPVIEAIELSNVQRRPGNEKIVAQGQKLMAVVQQRSDAATRVDTLRGSVERASALASAINTPASQAALAEQQRQLTAAQQQVDALTQQLDALHVDLMAALDHDQELLAELTEVLDQQSGGSIAKWKQTIELHNQMIDNLRKQLANKAAEPRLDAQQTIQVHDGIIQQNNDAIAKLQKQLQALTGPVFVMLDEHGLPAPPPGVATAAAAKP